MVFTKDALHILTSKKKGGAFDCVQQSRRHHVLTAAIDCIFCYVAASLLQELVGPTQSDVGISIHFLERPKGEDGSSEIQKLLDMLKDQEGPSVGTLPKVQAANLPVTLTTCIIQGQCHCTDKSCCVCVLPPSCLSLQDKPEGKLTDTWGNLLNESGLSTVDVSGAIADLLSAKDANEIMNTKKAAFMTASTMKSFTVPRLEGEHHLYGLQAITLA